MGEGGLAKARCKGSIVAFEIPTSLTLFHHDFQVFGERFSKEKKKEVGLFF